MRAVEASVTATDPVLHLIKIYFNEHTLTFRSIRGDVLKGWEA
jgi:hypothetical protein